MAIQQYGTVASRNLIRAEMKMLKHVEPIQVLGKFGDQKEQPLRKTDTVVFRRLKPFNATAEEVPSITAANFVTSEGTTPTANTISYTDVTAVLNQYAVLFKFSSKSELIYEDNIPDDMSKLTGETLAEVAELIAYGQVKAGTSVIYANGSTRVGVNTAISLGKLRLSARTMESNRGKKVTNSIKAGPDFDTSPVEESYVVFHHTDCNADIRDLSGFTKRVEYGSAIKPVHPREIGACEEFRFVPSPLFAPHLAAGASVGTSGMVAADDSDIDVYPMIIMAESAWGHISLKGHGYSGVSPTVIPSNVKNHANPSGMFGYVGADFWYAAIRLNENWMTRCEVAVTELDV
ncbi:MAG: N4-gp56 family major capsid protein [Desulfobacteraceae bacterium]|nr:N4-gp56 family major capsid protein [Desulfobacteraceae bacterium]